MEASEQSSSSSTHAKHLDDLVEKLLATKKSSLISGEKVDFVLAFLRQETTHVSPSFKHWVRKERQFEIKDLPALGLKDVLVCPAKAKKEVC